MSLLLALCAVALGASWSVVAPVPDATPIVLRSGHALRLELRGDGDMPTVTDAQGRAVAIEVSGGAIVVPAGPFKRELTVSLAPDTRARYRVTESIGSQRAWWRWERGVRRAWRRDESPPEAPRGGCLAARAELARELSPGVRDQVLASLIEERRSVGIWTHRRHDPWQSWDGSARTVKGPAAVRIRARQLSGTTRQFDVAVELNGGLLRTDRYVARHGSSRVLRVYVPQGEHTLAVTGGDGPLMQLDYRDWAVAPSLEGRDGQAQTELDLAELDYQAGHRDKALEVFRAAAHLESSWARLRTLELTDDPAEALRALMAPHDDNPALSCALTETGLRRGPLLPDEVMLERLLNEPGVDPASAAEWLQRYGEGRPLGADFLRAQAAHAPERRDAQRQVVRSNEEGARYQLVSPDVGAELASLRLHTGPGVQRAVVRAGASTRIHLPELPTNRFPVLRLDAPEGATWTVGDRQFSGKGLGMDVALRPGVHELSVSEGLVVLAQPDLALDPIERQYEWSVAHLPATWTLHGQGIRSTLRVAIQSDEVVWAEFDDGAVYPLRADEDTGLTKVEVGPYAQSVRLVGVGVAGVAMRAPVKHKDLRPAPSDLSLERLHSLSAAVDAGDNGARLERARLLYALGFVRLARRDVRMLAGTALAQQAKAIRTSPVQSRGHEGPVTEAAMRAMLGLSVDPARTPAQVAAEFDALYSTRPELPSLAVQASQKWVEAEEYARAFQSASVLGTASHASVRAVLSQLSFTGLSWPDQGSGSVEVDVPAPEPPGATAPLSARVAEAMLVLPWDRAEASVVRGDTIWRLRVPGKQYKIGLVCRDEGGLERSCPVRWRLDERRETIDVPHGGEPTWISVEAGAGRHELEIVAPGKRMALAIRVEIDGELASAPTRRTAWAIQPQRSTLTQVAGQSVLRVQCLDGSIEVLVGEQSRVLGPSEVAYLPLVDDRRYAVEIRGRGLALVARGTGGAAVEDEELDEEADLPPERLDEGTLRRLFSLALPTQSQGPLPAPGSAGSVQFEVMLSRAVLYAPFEPFNAVQVAIAWMRRDNLGWWRVEGWGHGPSMAAGGLLERGMRWKGGWVLARAEASGTSTFADEAWGFDAAVRARHDVRLAPSTRLRANLSAVGFVGSLPPFARVDPKVWSTYQVDHPFRVLAAVSAIVQPWRELRLEGGGRMTISRGLERAGPFAELDYLISPAWMVGLDAWAIFPTAKDGVTDLQIRLHGDYGVWVGRNGTRVSGFATFGVLPLRAGLTGELGMRVLLSFRRGLRDLPPDAEPFRTARGWP